MATSGISIATPIPDSNSLERFDLTFEFTHMFFDKSAI
jgi:hypothetical protein